MGDEENGEYRQFFQQFLLLRVKHIRGGSYKVKQKNHGKQRVIWSQILNHTMFVFYFLSRIRDKVIILNWKVRERTWDVYKDSTGVTQSQ